MHLATMSKSDNGNTGGTGELVDIFNKNCTNGHSDCISELPVSGRFWSPAEYDASRARYKSFDNGHEYRGYKFTTGYGALCVGN